MLKNNRLSKFISKLLLAGALTLIPAGYAIESMNKYWNE